MFEKCQLVVFSHAKVHVRILWWLEVGCITLPLDGFQSLRVGNDTG